MFKTISPRTHGYFDYAAGVLYVVAPLLFRFDRTPVTLSLVMGVLVVGLSLLTAYPMGAAKLVPFKVHGIIETAVVAASIILALVLRYSGGAMSFFIIVGVAYLVLVALTNYKAAAVERPISAPARRAHRVNV